MKAICALRLKALPVSKPRKKCDSIIGSPCVDRLPAHQAGALI